MIFREANAKDIKPIMMVRNSVKENKLLNPSLVTEKICLEFLTERGKGWVCEINNKVVGFSIVDLKNNNVWALFINPVFENRGIGKKLHDAMIEWYFRQKNEKIWLGTSPNTRAEGFYKKAGWIENGKHGEEEIKFEMTYKAWNKIK